MWNVRFGSRKSHILDRGDIVDPLGFKVSRLVCCRLFRSIRKKLPPKSLPISSHEVEMWNVMSCRKTDSETGTKPVIKFTAAITRASVDVKLLVWEVQIRQILLAVSRKQAKLNEWHSSSTNPFTILEPGNPSIDRVGLIRFVLYNICQCIYFWDISIPTKPFSKSFKIDQTK